MHRRFAEWMQPKIFFILFCENEKQFSLNLIVLTSMKRFFLQKMIQFFAKQQSNFAINPQRDVNLYFGHIFKLVLLQERQKDLPGARTMKPFKALLIAAL